MAIAPLSSDVPDSTHAMRPAIEVRGLTKRYRGGVVANDAIDLAIREGTMLGVLGHNGAGKTTLMKAMVGLVEARRGDGAPDVLGLAPLRSRVELLKSVCYIPDVAILPRWARVGELITLMSGLHPRFSAARALALLKRDNGCVLEWHLIGPIDQGEAVRRLRDVAATRAKEYAEAVDPVSRVDLSKMNG